MTEQTAPAEETIPFRRECPFSAPSSYMKMLADDPVSKVRMPNGDHIWAVTRYEDVRAVLTDKRFSSDNTQPGYPVFTVERPAEQPTRTMINLDGEEHAESRRDVMAEYTVKRVKDLRPQIQQIVDERIDALLAGPRPVDLVQEFAIQIPALVMSKQLGVPMDETDFFLSQAAPLVDVKTSETDRAQHMGQLAGYLMNLIAQKEENPGDDLLSRQIAKGRENGTYNQEALVYMAFLLLVAGHDTSTSMISLGTLALLQHPEELAKVTADPAKAPAMVEELLRMFTVGELAGARVATEDVEIGGKVIRAGEGLLALSNAGNHDPEVYPEPEKFDIDRPARSHLAFGHGAHQCIGQSLARLELEIVYTTLFSRIPGLKLAVPFDELKFKDYSPGYGLEELPVTW
ncbi:cytochrome P450 [Streptomyces sp. P1-3]|uniref:cytochrome P450 n=1 Tax=Streptomyces sp. P1-3 TaxID=3421658 RepID=UPI003D368ECB